MPRELLTDARVKGVEAPSTGILEIWDTRCAGLCLRVMPSGRKSWTVRFRPRGATKYRRERLGTYNDLGLAEARHAADKIRLEVRGGADPAADRLASISERRADEQRKALTFGELADLYIEKYAKPEKASWQNDAGYLNRDVREQWGRLAAASITRADAAKLLLEIRDRTPIGANRTRSVLAKLFGWAVDEGLLDASPMLGVRKPAKENKGKTRVLTDDELRVFWRALDKAPLSTGVVAALRTLILLGQRPGEIVGLQRSELVNLNKPKEARIEFPAERMKGRRPHVVPLPPMAAEIVKCAMTTDSDSVFASRYANVQMLARHSLSQAMRRVIGGLDPNGSDRDAARRLQAVPPTPHDLRRTLATRLAEFGIPREDRLAVLAHTWGDVHSQHYDQYERFREKRAALETWERHVHEILTGEMMSAEVVPITGRR